MASSTNTFAQPGHARAGQVRAPARTFRWPRMRTLRWPRAWMGQTRHPARARRIRPVIPAVIRLMAPYVGMRDAAGRRRGSTSTPCCETGGLLATRFLVLGRRGPPSSGVARESPAVVHFDRAISGAAARSRISPPARPRQRGAISAGRLRDRPVRPRPNPRVPANARTLPSDEGLYARRGRYRYRLCSPALPAAVPHGVVEERRGRRRLEVAC